MITWNKSVLQRISLSCKNRRKPSWESFVIFGKIEKKWKTEKKLEKSKMKKYNENTRKNKNNVKIKKKEE